MFAILVNHRRASQVMQQVSLFLRRFTFNSENLSIFSEVHVSEIVDASRDNAENAKVLDDLGTTLSCLSRQKHLALALAYHQHGLLSIIGAAQYVAGGHIIIIYYYYYWSSTLCCWRSHYYYLLLLLLEQHSMLLAVTQYHQHGWR